MTVLGVITCEILELEFAYLFARDSDIAGVTIVENSNSLNLIEAMEKAHVVPRRIPILKGFSPSHPDRLEVLVRVLELALHQHRHILQDGLIRAAREMGRYVDGILLGYGLCGNALQNPEELLADAGVPVFIPMDQDHPVDDCVGLIIGGRESYYQEQCHVAGTFFMIPGWTRHWKAMFQKEYGSLDAEFMRRIFGMSNYERSLLIPNPTLSIEDMQQNIEEFNRLFGFRTELKQGSLDMLQRTWESAKNHLTKNTEVE
jgi:hypothetical protein